MVQSNPPTAAGLYLHKTRRVRVLCLLPVFLIVAPFGGRAQQPPNIQMNNVLIQGMVRTPDGQTLGVSAKVQLQREDGDIIDETLTNSDGTYQFKPLAGGSYHLVVTAPGFEKYNEKIPSSMGIRVRVCNVILKPLAKEPENPAADEPRTESLVPRKAKKKYAQAMKELEVGQPDKAEAHLKSAVELYTCYVEAQAHLAVLLENHQDRTGAEGALEKAIQCDPDYASPYILLGQLLNDEKRFRESVPVLEEGERRAPSSWPLCYELGQAYFGIEEYSKAEMEFQKVSAFNDSPPPDLPLRLADVYIKQKAYEKAYAEMKKYLQAQPDGIYAEKVRDIVQRVDALERH
jgi:tetratricopeptide (TPR) repeat protein